MEKELEGKVIVLTGGTSGIGHECPLAYARECASVAVFDRNFEEAKGTAKEIGNGSAPRITSMFPKESQFKQRLLPC